MDFDEILKQVPVDDIAKRFGVSTDVARQAVQEGGAVLLGGLAKNAETDEGSAAIEKALNRHGGFAGANKVDDVDQADGGKIVQHVLGERRGEVTETLNKSEKTAGGIDFGQLLPILAPIIMGIIANARSGKGGGIGDILGGLLGGGSAGGRQQGGGLGDLLGGLLGGLFGNRK